MIKFFYLAFCRISVYRTYLYVLCLPNVVCYLRKRRQLDTFLAFSLSLCCSACTLSRRGATSVAEMRWSRISSSETASMVNNARRGFQCCSMDLLKTPSLSKKGKTYSTIYRDRNWRKMIKSTFLCLSSALSVAQEQKFCRSHPSLST